MRGSGPVVNNSLRLHIIVLTNIKPSFVEVSHGTRITAGVCAQQSTCGAIFPQQYPNLFKQWSNRTESVMNICESVRRQVYEMNLINLKPTMDKAVPVRVFKWFEMYQC